MVYDDVWRSKDGLLRVYLMKIDVLEVEDGFR